MRDLVALSVLPALWREVEPDAIVESLAELLLSTLDLDFVYLRLQSEPTDGVTEVARARLRPAGEAVTRAIRAALEGKLAVGTGGRHTIRNPVGSGTVGFLCLLIVASNIRWLLVAASGEPEFPTEGERLLLTAASQHAASALERATALQSLREREESSRVKGVHWQNLTDSLPQLVSTSAADGSHEFLSRQWQEVTGAPEHDLLGWKWMEWLHPDDRERARNGWAAAVRGQTAWELQYRLRTVGGDSAGSWLGSSR